MYGLVLIINLLVDILDIVFTVSDTILEQFLLLLV